jgi:hypothetical protein
MAHRNTPLVRHGRLITARGERISLDSPRWFAWLETATTFCYSNSDPLYRLTLRKEQRRHGWYWYAYLKVDAKLHNTYLGKSAALTLTRLEAASARLVQKVRQQQQGRQAGPRHTETEETGG